MKKTIKNNKKLEKELNNLTGDYKTKVSELLNQMLNNLGITQILLNKKNEYDDNDYYNITSVDTINGISLVEGENYYYDNEFDDESAKGVLVQITNEAQAKSLAENFSCEGINTDDAGEVEIQIAGITYLNKCSMDDLVQFLAYIPCLSEDLLNPYFN